MWQSEFYRPIWKTTIQGCAACLDSRLVILYGAHPVWNHHEPVGLILYNFVWRKMNKKFNFIADITTVAKQYWRFGKWKHTIIASRKEEEFQCPNFHTRGENDRPNRLHFNSYLSDVIRCVMMIIDQLNKCILIDRR
jgi:hypothetical protein